MQSNTDSNKTKRSKRNVQIHFIKETQSKNKEAKKTGKLVFYNAITLPRLDQSPKPISFAEIDRLILTFGMFLKGISITQKIYFEFCIKTLDCNGIIVRTLLRVLPTSAGTPNRNTAIDIVSVEVMQLLTIENIGFVFLLHMLDQLLESEVVR